MIHGYTNGPILKPFEWVNDDTGGLVLTDTGLPTYSDSVGTAIKCLCKRGDSYRVTVTGVTVSGEPCTGNQAR